MTLQLCQSSRLLHAVLVHLFQHTAFAAWRQFDQFPSVECSVPQDQVSANLFTQTLNYIYIFNALKL